MSEELKPETTETKPQIQENTTEVQPQNQVEASPDIKSESNKANWKTFRDEREKERKARIEAEKMAETKRAEAEALKAAMEALIAKPNQYQQEPQFHVEQSDEDLIEKKVQAALEKERYRVQQEQKQKDVVELPKKLEQTYRDFNKVCNTENLDYLEYHYPEVAKAFQYMPDGFDKWSSVYQAVKRFVPQDSKEDAKRIDHNQNRPKTSSPVMTDTKPQGSPWILTEERKKENWKRMMNERKSIG